MRQIDHIEVFPRELTYFQGSDGFEEQIKCTGIKSDEILLINNAEAVYNHRAEHQIFQTFICEADGISGCAFGNWISLRRYKDYYFLIPAFQVFEAEFDMRFSDDDAAPPKYIIENGVIYFKKELFTELSKFVPAFQELSKVKQLSIEEILRLYRFELYLQIFDTPYPTPKPANNSKLKTSLPGVSNFIERINDEFNLLNSATKFKLKRITTQDKELNIPIDSRIKKTIKLAIINGETLHLRLGDFKIVRLD